RIDYYDLARLSSADQVVLLEDLRDKELDRLTRSLKEIGPDAAEPTEKQESELDTQANSEGDSDSDDDTLDLAELAKTKTRYLAELKKLDPNKLDDRIRERTLSFLLDFHKPGLIIDGQHRVRGTRVANILFSITALPNATWEELAFQFIVLNKSAKKVPDSLLINIVGNSLSPLELQSIERRLDDSGIP